MRDVVGVVLAAKGNGILRPVEVGWRGLGDGEDFSVLALALPRGHVRRGPSEDEEDVLHRGELVVATLVVCVFLLVLISVRDTVVVLVKHFTLLKGVVDRALVVRSRLLEHVVKQAAITPRGASGTLAIWGSDEGLVGVLRLS